MRNVVLIEKETGNSFEQVMSMSYMVYLCHLYWIQQLNLESYEDQLSFLGVGSSDKNGKITELQTEPDWKRLGKLGGGM